MPGEMRVLFPLVAIFLIATAISFNQPLAIPLVLLSYVLVLFSSKFPRSSLPPSPVALKVLLILGAVQIVIALMSFPLVRSLLGSHYKWCLIPCVFLITFLILGYSLNWQRFRRLRFPLLCIVFGIMGSWLLTVSPQPGNDVWRFQHNAAGSLLSASHPYDISMPNPYSHTDFYGSGVLRDGQVYGFPYPPLSLLIVLPGYLFGDVRWVMLMAHIVLACIMVGITRSRGFPAGHHVELLPLAILIQPGSLFVLHQAWTESLFALAMALLAFASQRGAPTFRWLALAAVWSMKQYSILLPWAQWKSGAFRRHDWAFAALVTCTIILPFFVWNPQATWFSIVEFQFLQPIRPDSYSLNALLLNGDRAPLPLWFSLMSVVIVATWISSRWSAIRDNMCLTSAAVLFTLFVTTNVFINYLWAVTALLAIGVVLDFPTKEPYATLRQELQ